MYCNGIVNIPYTAHTSKLMRRQTDEAELPVAISGETPVSQHLKSVTLPGTLRELNRAKKLKINTLQAPRPTGCPWRVPRSRTWPERSQLSITLPKEDCALKEVMPRGSSLSWNVREPIKMETGRDEQTKAVRQTKILWQDIQTNSHKTPKFSTTPLRAKLQKRNEWYHNTNLDLDESKATSMSRFDVRISKVVGEPSAEAPYRFEVSDHVIARPGPKITLEKISKRIQLPITLGYDIVSPKNKVSCTYQKFQNLPKI